LESKLNITVNGKPVELFMSFGLLNKLTTLYNPTAGKALEETVFDADLRKDVLRLVLEKRGETGLFPADEAKKLDPDSLEISNEDFDKLFAWEMDHVSDFFLRAAENLKRLQEKNKERQAALMPSQTGSAG
jgi:hypothetical protein